MAKGQTYRMCGLMKTVSDISLLVFPGSTPLEDVVTLVIITPGLLL